MKTKINGIMVLFSVIGGLIGFVMGEVLLGSFQYSMPHSLLMGIYFGQLAFFIGVMCLIAEMISPRINGHAWKNNYARTSWKFLIPCTLVALFIAATILQFLYEINFKGQKVINDVAIAVDTSGSMSNTDPKNERFEAVKNLLNNMNSDNRAAIYVFNDKAEQVLAMTQITAEVRAEVDEKLKQYETPAGHTNMKDALDKALLHINETAESGRNAMVILLSDGGDNYDLGAKFNETMKPYEDKGIPVYTIGMAKENNFDTLKSIARATGGNYYSVSDVKDLKDVFKKIYLDRQQRLLVDKRNGLDQNSGVYAFLRVLFIALIGTAIAVSVSFIFDNKFLLKGFIIGGAISGVIAGFILEIGFNSVPWFGSLYRGLAAAIIAFVFTLFSRVQDIDEGSKKSFRKNSSLVSNSSGYRRNSGSSNNNSFK
ncbi:MAG: vWA domain-containing protein [Bacillota bacterium]|nr:vWA domain-containing protein [Bacillota bacterium]